MQHLLLHIYYVLWPDEFHQTPYPQTLEVKVMARRPHILAVSYPAQGHVTPLLKLSYRVASEGIKVTFVNTEFIHAKIIARMSDNEKGQTGITLASIPDGLDDDDDRKDFVKLKDSLRRVMPGYITDLIEKTNHSNNDEPIAFLIADVSVEWILEVAEKLCMEKVAFFPAGPAGMAFLHNMSKLTEAGLFDSNGNLTKDDQISLSNEFPSWNSMEFPWTVPGDLETQKLLFAMCLTTKRAADSVKFLLCNTFYELQPSACNLIPNILTIGPLLTSNHAESSASSGSFWLEDFSCLSWLDSHQAGSVVYVAFGSIAVFSQQQFDELELGLELSGRPFLWVVRSDLANGSTAVYPEGFLERAANRGKIVEWAPQEKVLAHPSIACFLSHCGWNSTIEGIIHAVPFLCWPYFADQFNNQNYICEFWKISLKLNPDGNGIRSRQEISTRIQRLLSDDNMKENALKLKDLGQISISKGGSSSINLEKFINHLKR